MGSWATQAETKSERCKEVIAECIWENENSKSVLVGKRVTNTGLWTLQTITNGVQTAHVLTIHKMGKYQGQWWVKSMTVDCGPYFYDCPKALVEKWVELNDHKFTNTWEERWYNSWKESEELWEKVQDLKAGDVVSVGSHKVVFKFWHKASKRQFVGHQEGSTQLYRWNTGNITNV